MYVVGRKGDRGGRDMVGMGTGYLGRSCFYDLWLLRGKELNGEIAIHTMSRGTRLCASFTVWKSLYTLIVPT